MKINVEVDCTPLEARNFMGLPDLTPVHDAYVGGMLDAMKNGGVPPDMLAAITKSWAPMGEAGLGMWQKLFDQATISPKS